MDWAQIDRWLIGEAWIGSQIGQHLTELCDGIGVRWAGSANEKRAAEYVLEQFQSQSLNGACIEEFELSTSDCHSASLQVVGNDSWSGDIRPCMFCPSINLESPLVDVGYGMSHELAARADKLPGSIALIQPEFEPFSEPLNLTTRLQELAKYGASAAITTGPHKGRRLQHMSAGDWRDDPQSIPLPLVQTSIEDFHWLSRQSNIQVQLKVDSEFRKTPSWNTVAQLNGESDENCIVLAAHHDTTPDSLGANDNGAGVSVLLDTARLLSGLANELNISPGCTIRLVSFGAEEQGLQGSFAFVRQHYGTEPIPKLMIALDELCTGTMKGVVLQFPELRELVQQQLNDMNEGLHCHVLSQMDASGDMFPFAQRGIPSSFLWRWRFFGKHSDTHYGHCSSDTLEKVRVRELKEYAGFLARLLLRLSHVSDDAWPENELDVNQIAERIEQERGTVFRTL